MWLRHAILVPQPIGGQVWLLDYMADFSTSLSRAHHHAVQYALKHATVQTLVQNITWKKKKRKKRYTQWNYHGSSLPKSWQTNSSLLHVTNNPKVWVYPKTGAYTKNISEGVQQQPGYGRWEFSSLSVPPLHLHFALRKVRITGSTNLMNPVCICPWLRSNWKLRQIFYILSTQCNLADSHLNKHCSNKCQQ